MDRSQLPTDQSLKEYLLKHKTTVYCPSSVYRLQLSARFTFRDARLVLSYLHDLGIDAVYLSPVFKAVPGSSHGYNVTDPTQLNPELGSQQDFDLFCDRLKELGMGLILDMVPNHMGISGSSNQLWLDVLENGPSSIYSQFFDIEWQPVKSELENKVLIPVLGDLYGNVLDRQEVRLVFDEGKGEFSIHYFETQLPVGPKTYPEVLEHRIDGLKERLGEESNEFLEFLSVITACKNLPDRTEADPAKILERNREKEIIKKRLAELVARSKEVREFIVARVKDFNGIPGNPKSFDLIDKLLNQQGYRMAFWRVAAEEINYRRFFDINELAAIRMEDERVFDYYHKMIVNLITDGKIQGLRIDHPDGLYDPPVYFRKLQKKYLEIMAEREFGEKICGKGKDGEAECREILRERIRKVLEGDEFLDATPLYVVVEKILDPKEPLPKNWNVQGTVGYEFLNYLNGLFVDQDRQKELSEIYESFIDHKIDLDQLIYDKKKIFALVHMASEINALGHRLDHISEKDRHYRDFTRNNLTLAIREVIAAFPVYRTYISPADEVVSERDQKYITVAIEKAKAKTPALNPAVYDFLKDVLLLNLDPEVTSEERKVYRDFVLRFQQLTGPIMAKGLEDTVFYIYNRLLSLNEVGGDPVHFGYSREEFHKHNQLKFERWPLSMITTSTHDTKRSEDARVRIDAISEMPEEWKNALARWTMINEKHKTVLKGVAEPGRNAEYFIYQTLLGAWPDQGHGPKGFPSFSDRILEYVLKAVREAKIQTNWVSPNTAYEEAVKKFVRAILDPVPENHFLKDFLPVQKRLSFCGKLTSISALVLKAGSPGVTDIYQGTEFWDYCLVDPDNRRSVDFELRKNLLNTVRKNFSLKLTEAQTLDDEKSGALKISILSRILRFRRAFPDVFLKGEYVPLKIDGVRERHGIAFARNSGKNLAIMVAGRLFNGLSLPPGKMPVGEGVWKDAKILLPEGIADETSSLRDVLTGREIFVYKEQGEKCLRLAEIFMDLPAAMLTGCNLEGIIP